MFKKLKDKIAEEVKSSPQRIQQFTQSVTEKIQNATSEENFFSIGDDDVPSSSPIPEPGFSNVSLSNYATPNSERFRKNSSSSIASDMSFLPRYESATNLYHLQSDLDVSASEIEDNASTSSQLGHLSKEQIYAAFQKSQMRYHKYRGRYTDIANHYKELERENGKMKAVLVETQDKALRRVAELKEQCGLEQKAKAHLENALRVELDEKQYVIDTLKTKIELLQTNQGEVNLVKVENVESNEDILMKDARAEIESLNDKIQELKANYIISSSKESDSKKKIGELEEAIKKKTSENAMILERERENNLIIAQTKMELHTEIQNRDLEIENLKRDVETLKVDVDRYENEPKIATNLQIQNSKLVEKVEDLSDRCKNYEGEVLKCEQQKIEIENLNKSLKSLRAQVRSLEEERVSEKCDASQLEALRESNLVEIERYKQELAAKEKEILELQEINKVVNSQLCTLQDELNKQSVEYEAKISTYREDTKHNLLSLENKIEEKLKEELEVKESILRKDFENKVHQLSRNSEDTQSIQLKLMAKEEEVDNLSFTIVDLKQKLQNQIESYKNLEGNHLQLISEHNEMSVSKANLEATRDDVFYRVNQLMERSARLEEENTNFRVEHEKTMAEVEDMRQELDLARSQVLNSTNVLSENKMYKRQLEEVEAKLELVNKQITEDLQNQIATLESNKENLNLQKNDLQTRVGDLEKQLQDFSGKNISLLADMEESSLNIANLEEQLSSELAYKDSLQKRLDLLQSELENGKQEIQQHRINYERLLKENDSSLNEIQVLNEKIVSSAETSQLVEAEYQKKCRTNEEVKSLHLAEVEDFELKLEVLEKDNLDLEGKNSELNSKLNQYCTEIEKNKQLLDELENFRSQCKKLAKDNDERLEEISNYTKEITKFKADLEKLQNRIDDLTDEKLKIQNHATSLQEKILEQNKETCRETAAFQEKINELTLQVEKSEAEQTILENLLEERTSELDLVKQQIPSNSVNPDKLLSENKSLQQRVIQLADFEKQVNRLEAQLRELEDQYTEISHEKQLLRDEIQELKASPINMTNCTNKKPEPILNLENSNEGAQLYKDRDFEINNLQEKLVQYKSLDLTNRSSIQFYENELQRLKNKNEKLNRKLDETLVTLNHCTELSMSTETVYLKNVLYNYMLGKESLVLARVIAAVCKFDETQTETILQREQQKQTLLGHLGFL